MHGHGLTRLPPRAAKLVEGRVNVARFTTLLKHGIYLPPLQARLGKIREATIPNGAVGRAQILAA